MGTAYLPITIAVQEGQFTLFECEPVAEVEYHVSSRDGLTDWHVSNLRFDDDKRVWSDTDQAWITVKAGEVWAPKAWFNLLLPHIDQTALEAQLVDHLLATGELSYSSPAMRADYHAAVI